ncbi:MAG TPA: 50S ribosomal protein L9 [Candidatus Babeliales bacterium]|jgi:large subunit ribosomal protein L9|nr:50S ribosomal protein L9 [Candidatus Babeliales bacterium]
MKVYLKENIERVGMAGEIISVSEGYARNFLIPRGFAVAITDANESFYKTRLKTIEHRKEVIESKTSMLAEKIAHLTVAIKRKLHDDGKLYGSVSQNEIAEALAAQGVHIAKNQVQIDKSIKEKGTYQVTIKLTSRLQPMLKVQVVSE